MESVDTLKTVSDSLNLVTQKACSSDSHSWIWIVIVLAIIILLVAVIAFKRTKSKPVDNLDMLKQQAKEQGNVDFGNVINSAFNSRQLYDKLKVRCHPDRFPLDDEKNAIANDIFQRIKQNEHNVEELKKLKEEAIKKLDITL